MIKNVPELLRTDNQNWDKVENLYFKIRGEDKGKAVTSLFKIYYGELSVSLPNYKRYISKVFTIADDVEITGAELKNGLLKVSLNKILPEGKKPRKIEVK